MFSYKVDLVISAGMPQDHHAIFVHTHADHSGHLFHVTSNIQTGMNYEHKAVGKPEEDPTFQGKTFIGTLDVANFPQAEILCETVPVPERQFEGVRRLDPQKRLRRCQEWTKDAVDALVEAKLLQV